jgi:hypothetical protein
VSLLRDIILSERAPAPVIGGYVILSPFITSHLPVEEMTANKGKGYDDTLSYQIRIKPQDKDTPLEDIQLQLEKLLKSAKGKKLGISDVQVNDRSPNSGKFSSVSCKLMDGEYDIVIAAGANKGEDFEKSLLVTLDNHVQGIETSELAEKALQALQGVDPVFRTKNIKSVVARSGSTKRSGDMSPEETGKIIADIIFVMKNGDKKYVSLKNENGATVAQFGLAGAFNKDLTVDTSSTEWKTLLAPFQLDPKKIHIGLLAARDQTEVPFEEIETLSRKVKTGSPISTLMQKMWGSGYYYLREKKGGFTAMKIDSDYINNSVLKDLTITEIRYPSSARKQISIYLHSDAMKFKLEVRNPKGKGDVRPSQIQLSVMKTLK